MGMKAGMYINFLANQNRAYVNTLLKSEKLTYLECKVILVIKEKEISSQEVLCKQVKVDKSAITRVVKSLIDKKYIEKVRNPLDNRSYCLSLTAECEEKVPKIYTVLKQGSKHLIETLSVEEVEQLDILLKKMCKHMGDVE